MAKHHPAYVGLAGNSEQIAVVPELRGERVPQPCILSAFGQNDKQSVRACRPL